MQHTTITPFASRPQATITAPTAELAAAAGIKINLSTGSMSKRKKLALHSITLQVAGERKPRESASDYCERAQSTLDAMLTTKLTHE